MHKINNDFRTYDITDEKYKQLSETFELKNEQVAKDIDFLMPVVMKIRFMKNKFPNVLNKDYETGNLAIMAKTSPKHKAILSFLENNVPVESIVTLMIESQKDAIHELYADLIDYYFTYYEQEVEEFGGEMPERRQDAYMYEMFDKLVEILV